MLTAGHISFRKTSDSFERNPYHLKLLFLSGPVAAGDAATMVRFSTPNSILGREATWVGTGLTGTGA